jgi:hypothetical protein
MMRLIGIAYPEVMAGVVKTKKPVLSIRAGRLFSASGYQPYL